MIFNKKAEKVSGDYEKDGLLHCGKCNTPKEYIVAKTWTNQSESIKVPVMCACSLAHEKEQSEKRKQIEFQAWKNKMINENLGNAKNRQCTFENDDLSNPEATTIGKAYVANWDRVKKENLGLLFHGPVGTGKTFHTLCIANALIDKGNSVYFTSIPREIAKLQGAYPEERQRIIHKLTTSSLLVLDDVGSERNTSFAIEQVYMIIDARHEAGKPTIATTNTSLEELENPNEIGYDRIYDRLLSMCQFKIFCGGTSKRKETAAEKENKALRTLGLI